MVPEEDRKLVSTLCSNVIFLVSRVFHDIIASMLQFMSMKLATVNPKVKINIERIMSKDVSEHQCETFLKLSSITYFIFALLL